MTRNTGVDEKIEAEFDVESLLYTPRERAALEMATMFTEDYQAITDEHVDRWLEHFTEPELVELGCMIGLTLGQQSWLRLLNIEHHEVLAGTDASMAPGFETADALARSKSAEAYWARASGV